MSIGGSNWLRFVGALGVSTLVGVGLFVFGAAHFAYPMPSYLLWNIFLSWLPFLFALWLIKTLKNKLWSSWEGLLASVLWLIFLPNSFYMVSDYIHLQDVPPDNVLYFAVMFTSFIFTALALGFVSLYFVHIEFLKRFSSRISAGWVGFVLLVCSFAIYIGRDLRWNSWDIFLSPAGLLFNVSDRLIHPSSYPDVLLTTLSFFALLAGMYVLIWYAVRLLRQNHNS